MLGMLDMLRAGEMLDMLGCEGRDCVHRLHGGGSNVRLRQDLTRVVGGGGYTTLASTLYLTQGDRLTIGVVAWDSHVGVL